MLKSLGWRIYKNKKEYTVIFPCGETLDSPLTGRQIIKAARVHCKSWSKRIKEISKRKDRAATRDSLQTEEFDKIPAPRG